MFKMKTVLRGKIVPIENWFRSDLPLFSEDMHNFTDVLMVNKMAIFVVGVVS